MNRFAMLSLFACLTCPIAASAQQEIIIRQFRGHNAEQSYHDAQSIYWAQQNLSDEQYAASVRTSERLESFAKTAKPRTWIAGKEQFVARFLDLDESDNNIVFLDRAHFLGFHAYNEPAPLTGWNRVSIARSALCPNDQKWIDKELKRRNKLNPTLQNPPPLKTPFKAEPPRKK